MPGPCTCGHVAGCHPLMGGSRCTEPGCRCNHYDPAPPAIVAEALAPLTVAGRLEQMVEELGWLVAACNRDGLHSVATQAQAALELVAAIDSNGHIPETATWPPAVWRGDDNETHWRVS